MDKLSRVSTKKELIVSTASINKVVFPKEIHASFGKIIIA